MDLTNQKKQGEDNIIIFDSLNASLMSIKIKPKKDVIAPNSNDLIISVGNINSGLESEEAQIKNYVYNLSKPLSNNTDYGEFNQEIFMENNEVKRKAFIKWIDEDDDITIEELEVNDIVLFEGYNMLSTNYQNVDIEILYPSNTNFDKVFLNTTTNNTNQRLSNSLTSDDLYFKDAFTKVGTELNEEIDNLNVKCITSKNNKFSLDCDGNLIVNTITTNNSSSSQSNETIRDFIYPIGSIYMSVNNINPNTLFGGSWEQLKDRFLLMAGNIYQNGTVGGEATHKLTALESGLPSHNHQLRGLWGELGGGEFTVGTKSNQNEVMHTTYTSVAQDASQAHNNMPPYLVVYGWKRVS